MGFQVKKKIAAVYGKDKVIPAYFIGHSAVRDGNSVTQDGVGKIVFGANGRLENSLKKIILIMKFLKILFILYGLSLQ